MHLVGFTIKKVSRYCCPNHHRLVSVFHSWNKAFRIIGFHGRRDGRIVGIHYVFTIIKSPAFVITKSSFPVFSVVFINQMYSKCSCTVDVGFVKLPSDCCCEKRWFYYKENSYDYSNKNVKKGSKHFVK